MHGRCDRVIEITVASSYVRHLARIFDTTSHFLAGLHDKHIRLLGVERGEGEVPSVGDTEVDRGWHGVDEEQDWDMCADEEGVYVQSLLNEPVWLLFAEDGKQERQVAVPAGGKLPLGTVGLSGHGVGREGIGSSWSVRLKKRADAEWSQPYSGEQDAFILCPGLAGDQSFVVRVMVQSGFAGASRDGEAIVLCPLWRLHNLLPLDFHFDLCDEPAPERCAEPTGGMPCSEQKEKEPALVRLSSRA